MKKISNDQKLELSFSQLSKENWPDFQTLFAKHKGVRGGCWCAEKICTSAQFTKMEKDDRRAYHKRFVAECGPYGVLVYDRETPIAWCQFGRAELFPFYSRNKAYVAIPDLQRVKPDWRLTCLFVDKNFRRQGLSKYLVQVALKVIKRNGGGVVEAFPLHVPDSKYPQYSGSVRLFTELGFKKVAKLGVTRFLMRTVVK